jgi:hypothetical protein
MILQFQGKLVGVPDVDNAVIGVNEPTPPPPPTPFPWNTFTDIGMENYGRKGMPAGLGRGIIKQTSLAKPGPAWRRALEYLPHPTGMS